MKDEIFEGDNEYFCDNCDRKSKRTIRHQTINYLPNYVILTINRFEFDRKLLKKVKINKYVEL